MLVSVDWRKEQGSEIVAVAADTPEGITIEKLGSITRAILPILDEEPWAKVDIRLEVSSPGLDNPLRFPWQYDRHKGYGIHVEFSVGDVVREIDGVCAGVVEDSLHVSVASGVEQIELSRIRRAVVLAGLKIK